MNYMANGGFRRNPLMRLTLALTLVLLAGFAITMAALYFAKMGFSPESVVDYYRGSNISYRPPRSYQSMLEVTHGHLAMMAMVLLVLTHLVIFLPTRRGAKVAIIVATFGSALFGEASSWLVRFVHPGFALLKVLSFVTLELCLLGLLGALAAFLWRGGNRS